MKLRGMLARVMAQFLFITPTKKWGRCVIVAANFIGFVKVVVKVFTQIWLRSKRRMKAAAELAQRGQYNARITTCSKVKTNYGNKYYEQRKKLKRR
jgi:hypothetical protein